MNETNLNHHSEPRATSDHTNEIPNTDKHEAKSKAEHYNDQSQIELAVLPPASTVPAIEKVISDEATYKSDSKAYEPKPSGQWRERVSLDRVLSIVLAISAMASAAVAVYTSSQNQTLIAVNETLAGTARQQAVASDKQVELMRQALEQEKSAGMEASKDQARLITANEQFAEAAKKQAEAAATHASIAEQSMIRSLRPYVSSKVAVVGWPEKYEPVEAKLTLFNTGNSSAIVEGRITLIVSDDQISKVRPNQYWVPFGPVEVLPKDKIEPIILTEHIDVETLDKIFNEKQLYLAVYGEGIYSSFGQVHSITFATCYLPHKDTYVECSISNPYRNKAKPK